MHGVGVQWEVDGQGIEQSMVHSLKNLAKSSEGKRNAAGRTGNRILTNNIMNIFNPTI